ncbi:MAG: hypothetical protein EBX39_12270 [Actinobacteria bacterium]|nr:hypothetical protein [Actinomycetota bacterium]
MYGRDLLGAAVRRRSRRAHATSGTRWQAAITVTAAIGGFVALPQSSNAAPFTWSGASTTTSGWGGASNWLPSSLPSIGTNALVFTGANRLTNQATTNYTLDGITFSGSAQSFNLQGNSPTRTLNMLGDITNQSGRLQTIGGTTTGSKLALSYGTNAVTRTIDTGSGTIDLNAAVRGGSNVTLNKTGIGGLVIDNPPGTGHGFSGTFRASEGTVDLQAMFNANVGVSGSATLNVDPVAGGITTATVNSLTSSGTVNMLGSLTVYESLKLNASSVLNLTLPVDPNEANQLSYGAGTMLGGALHVTLLGDYPDADTSNPTVFQILQSTAGDPGGNFTTVTATYNGQLLSFTQGPDAVDPHVWISQMAADGKQLRFDQISGEVVVVPEPSSIVIAGIGAAMAAWNALKSRRKRLRALRPTFET